MPSPRSASFSTRRKPRKRSSLRRTLRRFGSERGRLRILRIFGHSMSPVLNPGELVLVREGVFDDRSPRKGELVAVRPSKLGGQAFVKRIAALPSERVTIDGKEWRLSRDEFFLLGDRVEHSLDSRIFGPVTRDELIGPVQARLWPWTVFDLSP